MYCRTASLETPTVYECEGFRLPTHAEREYATRAGTTTALYNGELTEYESDYYCGPDANLEQIAWYCYNAGKLGRVSSQPVAKLAPNGFGLYDMLGNISEFGHDYQSWSAPPAGVNPRGTMDATRDLRHLYSCNSSLYAYFCRAAENLAAGWNESGRGVGFRLVRTLFE